jgi:Flp pilus assembly protein TadG
VVTTTRLLFGRRPDERGDATLGFVLVTPAILVLILSAVYLGLWTHCRTVATAAAQEGLAAARVENGDPAAGEARANRYLDALAPSRFIEREVSSQRTAEEARVEVRGVVDDIFPGLRFSVRAVARAPVERFEGDVEP